MCEWPGVSGVRLMAVMIAATPSKTAPMTLASSGSRWTAVTTKRNSATALIARLRVFDVFTIANARETLRGNQRSIRGFWPHFVSWKMENDGDSLIRGEAVLNIERWPTLVLITLWGTVPARRRA